MMHISANYFRRGRFALLSWVILLVWVGCSDPGSGGSGIPTSNSAATTAAPQTLNGTVEEVSANAIKIAGVSYLRTELEIRSTASDSMPANPALGGAANLAVGMQVQVIDLGAGRMPRWRIVLP